VKENRAPPTVGRRVLCGDVLVLPMAGSVLAVLGAGDESPVARLRESRRSKEPEDGAHALVA
jgi:hypothetical protein